MDFLPVSAFILSMACTWLVRHYALRRGVLDLPNHRSSHTQPTPRGGGLAIVLAFLLCGLPYANNTGVGANAGWWALYAGFSAIATVGYWDDHQPLPARIRFVAHLAAALVLVWVLQLPVPPQLQWVFNPQLAFAQAGWALFQVLMVAWLINLTNFMDGIDGIAGVQAFGASIGFALLWLCAELPLQAVVPVLVFAAAALGFLVFNFPPAKIFMGDVGSGALGFAFGGFILLYAQVDLHWAMAWLILLAVFITDATVTLLVRVARGKNPGEAHRSHAFQIAARRFKAHRPVTLAVAGILVAWLLPVAAVYVSGHLAVHWALLLAYGPLVALAVTLKAGRQDD
ncbi:MAG TPA: glycosyltransferase family 4 protein [Limnobacter sp.]|uniref:MraY family glycosyltransferase n=1 Tax=Limnobacter sp. TaxID=2003368 RepID=UPI002ED89183